MNFEEIKKIVNRAGFSEISLLSLNALLDRAIKMGDMTSSEKKEALKIVDKEVDEGNLDIDMVADIAIAFTELAEDVDEFDEFLTNDMEEIEKAVVEDMEKKV